MATKPIGGDYDIYQEITKSDVKEITKEEYDRIKQKEMQDAGLDVYEAVDDPQDADEIISNMTIDNEIDTESADTDLIQPEYIIVTPADEKCVDKTDISKPGTQLAGKAVSCSEINNNTFSYDMKLSDYFKLVDLTTRPVVSKYNIPETKTVKGITYTKYDMACNLKALSVNVLDKIKAQYNDMIITSAFRNKPGSSSQHDIGQAADMNFTNHRQQDYVTIARWIQLNVPYDQLLFEFRNPSSVWIHVSWNPKGNRSNSAPYPKYATFLNDKAYKRLAIENVPNFSFRT